MSSIDDRIASLEAKLKQEKAKKQQIEARKRAAEAQSKRRDDTRRKILIGSAILAKVEAGTWSEQQLHDLLAGFLTRPDDRVLFGLVETADTPTT